MFRPSRSMSLRVPDFEPVFAPGRTTVDAHRNRRQRDLRPRRGLRPRAGARGGGLRARRPAGRPREHRPARRARARHRLPRPQRAELPAARPALRRARRPDARVGDVVLGRVRGLRARVLGHAPVRRSRRNAARPGFLALLWEIGRWLRTARASLDHADYETRSLARVPRRASATRRRSVGTSSSRSPRRSGRRRPDARSSSRRRMRSASSTTTACSASAASAGARSPAAAARTSTRSPTGSVSACTSGSACGRFAARPTASSCARDDGDAPSLRPASSSRRTPTRRSRCSRTRPTTSGARSAASTTPERRRPPHRLVVPAARARAPAPRGTTGSRDDGRPTLTYHLNRLQRLDAERDYCVTLNEQVAEEHVLGALHLRASALHGRRRCGRSASCPRSPGRATRWYAGAHFGNGFHEDGLAVGRRGRRRARGRLVRSALYAGTLMHARRTPRGTSSAIPSRTSCSTSTSCRSSSGGCGSFSRNRRNLVTLHDRDHFDGGARQAGGARASPATRRSSAC